MSEDWRTHADGTEFWPPSLFNGLPSVRTGQEPRRGDDYVPPYIHGLLERIAGLEAERDAVWNNALAAAIDAAGATDHGVSGDAIAEGSYLDGWGSGITAYRATIRALKRGSGT